MTESVQNSRKASTVLSLYREIWSLLKPGINANICGFAKSFLFSLGGIFASVCTPFFLAAIIDKLLSNRDTGLFVWCCVALVLALLIEAVSSFSSTYFSGRSTELMILHLRGQLVSAIMRKPAKFFTRYETGDLVTRLANDSESLGEEFFDYFFPNLQRTVFLLSTVVIMLSWEWHLGLYTTLSIPFYVFLVSLFQKSLSNAAQLARVMLSEQNATMLDILSGISEIRFYQQSRERSQHFSRAAGQFTAANIRSIKIGEWSFNTMEVLTRLIGLLPFILGGYLICLGTSTITIGQLVGYNLYMTSLAGVLQTCIFSLTRIPRAFPLAVRLKEIIDYPEEEKFSVTDIADTMDSTRIEYQGVYFGHQTGKPVIQNFNLAIAPGEKIAISGPSGSGKSTLIELLIRYIEPDHGGILLDGRPIRYYNLSLYLQQFSYVRQSPHIFRSSIRENIALGWYGVPLEVIIDAAKRVHIHDTIMQMENGYDTVIGTRGCDLSGGQRQRLALARALVRDPAVLLLDEFTSALDHTTERAVLDDLFSCFAKQTIICVTHSPSVASRFDRIIKVEKL